MTRLKLEELAKDIEENMLVNGEHLILNKTRRKKLKRLLNSIDMNEKNRWKLYIFHSLFREILAISIFDTIEYNIPNNIMEVKDIKPKYRIGDTFRRIGTLGYTWWEVKEIVYGVIEPIYVLKMMPFGKDVIEVGESELCEKWKVLKNLMLK